MIYPVYNEHVESAVMEDVGYPTLKKQQQQ